MDRDEARAVARLLAAEIAALPVLAGDAAPLLGSLPGWVRDPDE
jgi:hypothetical protein